MIVFSHVLEHIRSPGMLLPRVLESAEQGAVVIVALPNVMWWKQRLEFLRGRFRYADAGVMDRTHVHFFDRVEAVRILNAGGLIVERSVTYGGWPGSRFLGSARTFIDRWAVGAFPGLFGVEFIFVCRLRGEGQEHG